MIIFVLIVTLSPMVQLILIIAVIVFKALREQTLANWTVWEFGVVLPQMQNAAFAAPLIPKTTAGFATTIQLTTASRIAAEPGVAWLPWMIVGFAIVMLEMTTNVLIAMINPMAQMESLTMAMKPILTIAAFA